MNEISTLIEYPGLEAQLELAEIKRKQSMAVKAYLIIYMGSCWETRALYEDDSVAAIRKDKSRSKAYSYLFHSCGNQNALVIRLTQYGKICRICEFFEGGISSNWSISQAKDCVAKFGLSEDEL
jgi:hypothetical protein